MTVLRTSQVVAEVLRLPTAPALQTSSLVVEVLRINGTESSIFTSSLDRTLSMEYVFNGQPFIQLAKSSVDTYGLDFAFEGQPFTATSLPAPPPECELVGTPGVIKTLDSGATSVVTLPAGNLGDCAYVLCGNYPSGFDSVVGSVNGAYTKDVSKFDNDNNAAEIWRHENAAASTETITLTPTVTSGNYVVAVACRFSKIVKTSSPLDQTGTVDDSRTVAASAENTQPDVLSLIMAVADESSSDYGFGVPDGYTLLALENASDTYTGFMAAYKVTTQFETSGGTLTSTNAYIDQVIATYKIAAEEEEEEEEEPSTRRPVVIFFG